MNFFVFFCESFCVQGFRREPCHGPQAAELAASRGRREPPASWRELNTQSKKRGGSAGSWPCVYSVLDSLNRQARAALDYPPRPLLPYKLPFWCSSQSSMRRVNSAAQMRVDKLSLLAFIHDFTTPLGPAKSEPKGTAAKIGLHVTALNNLPFCSSSVLRCAGSLRSWELA